MKNKKKLISLFLLLNPLLIYAVDTSKAAEKMDLNFRLMDLPLLDGMAYFLSTMTSFANIASKLAIMLFLVTLCWNAFRLWYGTQQVRKAAVDIMMKCLLFTAVVTCYRGIQFGVLDLSMKVGSLAGGGAAEISTSFSDLRTNIENKLEVAQSTMIKLFKNAGENGGGLSKNDVKKFAKATGFTEEEVNKKASEYGVKVTDNGLSFKTFFYEGIAGMIVRGVQNKKAYSKMYENLNGEDIDTFNQMLDDGEGDKILVLLNAFNEVLTPNPDWENASDTQKFEDNIDKYIYSPFITSTVEKADGTTYTAEDWKKTGMNSGVLVSPGAMIKTACLIVSVLDAAQTKTPDGNGGFMHRVFNVPTWEDVIHFILLAIMALGIVFSAIFCVIQYVMCVFEYFITTSIGIIFVPCILFDGTKSFASKLVTLFTSYFIKITVMLLCLFWTFSTYIKTGMMIMTSSNPLNWLNFSYLMFTMLLGFVVTQNAPQVAVTILNGSPQLSMGEFLHAAGTIAGGAALAAKGAKMAHGAVQAGGKVADSAVSGVASGIAAAQGTAEGGGSRGDALKSGLKTAGSAWGSGIVNSASRFVIGRDVAGNGATSGGFRKGSVQTIADTNEKSGKWDATDANEFKKTAREDGKNSLASVRMAAKLNAQNASKAKNASPAGNADSKNETPKDTTEKVESTRQSADNSKV